MKTKESYIPSNGIEGALFEESHCYQCSNYVYAENLNGEDCSQNLLTKAWWEGEAPEWFAIYEDGERVSTGCNKFCQVAFSRNK